MIVATVVKTAVETIALNAYSTYKRKLVNDSLNVFTAFVDPASYQKSVLTLQILNNIETKLAEKNK